MKKYRIGFAVPPKGMHTTEQAKAFTGKIVGFDNVRAQLNELIDACVGSSCWYGDEPKLMLLMLMKS